MISKSKPAGEPTQWAPIALVAAVVVIVCLLGYILWSRTAVPEPVIPEGQTVQHPFGASGTRDGPTGGTPSRGGGPSQPPAPGTLDPQRGFGPSQGGPFRPR